MIALPFANRRQAGLVLSKELAAYREALVLAIPRGGVEVGAPVAEALDGKLDVLVTRKIGAPFDPELAVGAVTPDGEVILNEALLRRFGLAPGELSGVIEVAGKEWRRRAEYYRGSRPLPRIAGREVIIVDDGIATGLTIRAGIEWLRSQGPKWIVLAVPVGPERIWLQLRALVDAGVCLATPEPFEAVSQFYEDFSPTTDGQVIALLQENWSRTPPG